MSFKGFPGGSAGKQFAYNAGDRGSIPGSGRSPGVGNGHPLHYSCLENPMDGGTWWATVQGGHKESDRTDFTHSLRFSDSLPSEPPGKPLKELVIENTNTSHMPTKKHFQILNKWNLFTKYKYFHKNKCHFPIKASKRYFWKHIVLKTKHTLLLSKAI